MLSETIASTSASANSAVGAGRAIPENSPVEALMVLAKNESEDYRQDYNQNRPHSSLGYMTPNEFKQNWHHNNQGLTAVLAH